MTGIGQKIKETLVGGQTTGDTGVQSGSTVGNQTGTTGLGHTTGTTSGTTGLGGTSSTPGYGGTGTTGTTSGTPGYGGTGTTSSTTGYGGTGTAGLTSGTTGGTTGVTGVGRGVVGGGEGQVIDSKTFTKTEDHEVLLEKKAYELQHRPVEKEYVVETKFVGEQRVPGAPTELVGTDERAVEERVVQAPAGDRAVIVENVDVPRGAVQQQTIGTTGTTGTSGTGTTSTGLGGTGTGTGTGSTF